MVIHGYAHAANQLPTDLNKLTATEAAQMICKKQITSEQLIRAYLNKIQSHPNLNAFISVNPDRAIAEAKAWDKKQTTSSGCLPLGGVPVAVKDNTQVIGFPNTAGTPALAHFMPKTTAPVIQKLIDAGAIVIGKTNMHELAYGATGYNTAMHMPGIVGVRNAYDSSRIPGGSSSGSAVAVAAGMVPIAMGTDTGASVRQPCALNGCVGFRPTTGRYSQQGITPISHTRDTAGPMAHTVADVALMDHVISGAEILPPAEPQHIRLGISPYFWQGLDKDVSENAHRALQKLREAGVELVVTEMPGLEQANVAVSLPVVVYEGKHDLIKYLSDNQTGVSFEQVAAKVSSPDVKNIFDHALIPQTVVDANGSIVPAEVIHQKAVTEGLPHLLNIYKRAFANNRLDGLIFPTSPVIAPLADDKVSSGAEFAKLIHNTDPGSNIRLPGLSIPAGLGAQTHMPVGIEIDGLPGDDAKILAIGATVENIIKE
ncbi:amidase [Enterobacter sp. 10-1]|nr:indoleacetamide hydrolase [Raoultella sp. 10-1]MVT04092.1 indoleacetamide hydrolase [Raoultella sp. 10-1]PAC10206.1 amidase [Enterobacter sp. 10-1]